MKYFDTLHRSHSVGTKRDIWVEQRPFLVTSCFPTAHEEH